jgi:hypothetical protein
MEARGFTVLKPRMVSSEEDGGSDFTRAGPTDEAALRWGRQIGADVVVLGNAVAQGTGNVSGTGTHAVEARVSLRALRVDTAESIGSFQAANAAVHRNEETAGMDALELATSDIAEELSRQIAAGWRGESSHTRLVKLFVTGIEKYADFVQLRRTLKNEITGTKNVYLRGIRTEEAQVDVEVQGTARMLAEELVLKNFNDFGINVVEVGQNTIRLSLIPKGNDTPVTETPQESIETEPLAW